MISTARYSLTVREDSIHFRVVIRPRNKAYARTYWNTVGHAFSELDAPDRRRVVEIKSRIFVKLAVYEGLRQDD